MSHPQAVELYSLQVFYLHACCFTRLFFHTCSVFAASQLPIFSILLKLPSLSPVLLLAIKHLYYVLESPSVPFKASYFQMLLVVPIFLWGLLSPKVPSFHSLTNWSYALVYH